MTDGDQPTAAERAERCRALERIFGEVLPDSTSDDRDAAEAVAPEAGEDWLRAQVPPHHGG